jgi:hypothetical protein
MPVSEEGEIWPRYSKLRFMGVIERMSIIPYYYLNSQPKLEYGLVFCH